jgi:hypothetical protein
MDEASRKRRTGAASLIRRNRPSQHQSGTGRPQVVRSHALCRARHRFDSGTGSFVRRTRRSSGSDDGPRVHFSRGEALFRCRHRRSRIGLSDKAGTSRSGAKDFTRSDRFAVCRHRAACCDQPGARTRHTLEQDDRGRRMAGMPALDSDHRDRALRYRHLGSAKSRAHESLARGSFRRSHCRWRERDGLRSSLHG